MGEEREELIHEVRDRRGRQTGETGVLTGNSGSKLGSRGGGGTGWELGTLGSGQRAERGITQESHKGQWTTCLRIREHGVGAKKASGEDHDVWGAEAVWEGPPGPAFPASSLTSAYSALLLPSTSANKRAPGLLTARPLLSANHRRPCLPAAPPPRRNRCARGRRGRGSATFSNRPMAGAPTAERDRAVGCSQSSPAECGAVCAWRKDHVTAFGRHVDERQNS